MTRMFLRSALVTTAMLTLSLLAGISHAQDDCPNCPGGGIHGRLGHHGHLGHHGLHGGHGLHGAHGHLLHHHPNASPYDGSLVGTGHGKYNALGNCNYRNYAAQDLFYNYYVGNNCGGMGAQLYLSPRPVPPFVGHTYITYQPLMPHEFMYAHHRGYHRYYNGGQGLTRTSVHYYAPLFRR